LLIFFFYFSNFILYHYVIKWTLSFTCCTIKLDWTLVGSKVCEETKSVKIASISEQDCSSLWPKTARLFPRNYGWFYSHKRQFFSWNRVLVKNMGYIPRSSLSELKKKPNQKTSGLKRELLKSCVWTVAKIHSAFKQKFKVAFFIDK